MAAIAPRMIDSKTGFGVGKTSLGSAQSGATDCPIDLVHLARQTMGDRALEVELLALFDRQAAQIAQKLGAQDSDATQDSNAAAGWRADLAHKLKGSARAIGAHGVAAAAENYEHCARAGILRPVDAALLVEAVAEVRAALRELAG
jgi:HPt (histidine-containing phosphotransfer) domain-containing protein